MTLSQKQIITAVAVLTAVGIAIWGAIAVRAKEKAPPTPRRAPFPVWVALQQVVPTAVPRRFEAVGTVRPQFETALSAKVLGRVSKVLVTEGQAVCKNQVLIRLDARDLDAAAAQAAAGFDASHARKAAAQAALQMEAAVSTARLGEAQANVAQSDAALRVAQAHLALLRAGTRDQERKQAAQAVAATRADLVLAAENLRRMGDLYRSEAIAKQQLDQYQAQYDTAHARYEQAVQAEDITREGSRIEEIRTADEAVQQAWAGVSVARAAVRTAKANALQIAVRRAEVREVQAQIEQAGAAAVLARINRGYGNIIAPFNGVIASRFADSGALVNPGVPLLKIQGGALQLEASVPEGLLPAVHPGASVPVRLDALRNAAVVGKVVEIVPQGDAVSHTFTVKIRLPDSPGIAVGLFGRARLVVGTDKSLLIPRAALIERDGLFYLYTVDTVQIAHLRMVTVGAGEGSRVRVLSGLSRGETIVTAGLQSLHDGAAVRNGE